MITLDNVTVADKYPNENAQQPAAIMFPAVKSSGGYFTIANNPVYVELAYNIESADYGHGQSRWTKEIPFPVGPGILLPGTVGIRFRNYTAGANASVSGALAEHAEPSITVTSSGVASSGSGSGGLTGDIVWSAINSTTRAGSLYCNGAAVSRITFANLFAAIGTLYGVGDGASTFNIPDLRDRVPVGAGGNTAAGANDGVLAANRFNTRHRHTPHSHSYNSSQSNGINQAPVTAGWFPWSQEVGNTTGTKDGGSGVATDPLDGPGYVGLMPFIIT